MIRQDFREQFGRHARMLPDARREYIGLTGVLGSYDPHLAPHPHRHRGRRDRWRPPRSPARPTVSAATVPTVNGTTLTLTGDDAADTRHDRRRRQPNLGAAVNCGSDIDRPRRPARWPPTSRSTSSSTPAAATTRSRSPRRRPGRASADGGAGNDLLTGNNAAESSRGGDGNDRLVGARGGDTMDGGAGNDVLVWNNGDGSDVMDGDGGADEIEVNGAADAGRRLHDQAQPGRHARSLRPRQPRARSTSTSAPSG